MTPLFPSDGLYILQAIMTCKIEFENLEKWKAWFDDGVETELVSALELVERSVKMKGIKSAYAKARKPYIDYARKKLSERFGDWEVPF